MEHGKNQQIQDVIASNDLIGAKVELTLAVNRSGFDIQIDPFALYCLKTGAKIGQRSENQIFQAIKIAGKTEFKNSIFYATGLNVSPHWIHTGYVPGHSSQGVILDRLQVIDPVGYAVYCFNLATARFYRAPFVKKRDEMQVQAERNWATARAHALLFNFPCENLAELNVHLCTLLTYAPESLAYIYRLLGNHAKTPDNLALLAVHGELIPILIKTVQSALNSIGLSKSEIDRTKFAERPVSPADAARGPSQIRGQSQSRKNVRLAMLEQQFAEFGAIIREAEQLTGEGKRFELSIKGKLRALGIEYRTAPTVHDFEQDLGSLDALENEVEIRRIPMAGSTESDLDRHSSRAKPAHQAVTSEEQPAQVMTFRERIAKLQAQREEALKPHLEASKPHLSVLDRMRARLQERS